MKAILFLLFELFIVQGFKVLESVDIDQIVIETKEETLQNGIICNHHICKLDVSTILSNSEGVTLNELREKLPKAFETKTGCADWRFVKKSKFRNGKITTVDLNPLNSEKHIKVDDFIDNGGRTIIMCNFYETDLTKINVYSGVSKYEIIINPNMELSVLRALLTKEIQCDNVPGLVLPEENGLDTSNGQSWRVVNSRVKTKDIQNLEQAYITYPEIVLTLEQEKSMTVSNSMKKIADNEYFLEYTNLYGEEPQFVGIEAKYFASGDIIVEIKKRADEDNNLMKPIMLSYLRSMDKNGTMWRNVVLAENGTEFFLKVCHIRAPDFKITFGRDSDTLPSLENCFGGCCYIKSYMDTGKKLIIQSQDVIGGEEDMKSQKQTFTVSIIPDWRMPWADLDKLRYLQRVRTLKKQYRTYERKYEKSKSDHEEIKFTLFIFKSRAIADNMIHLVPQGDYIES